MIDKLVCMQLPSYTARAGQDTGEDEALARRLQQELNSDSSASNSGRTVEADMALARRLQDKAGHEASGRSQPHSSGTLSAHFHLCQCWHVSLNQ